MALSLSGRQLLFCDVSFLLDDLPFTPKCSWYDGFTGFCPLEAFSKDRPPHTHTRTHTHTHAHHLSFENNLETLQTCSWWWCFSFLSTLETTFDTTVTTEVNGRGLPALTTRSSPMAWRLGQSQTPRLQAGDAPSMPGSYATPRGSTTGSGTSAGRYSGHSDPSRCVNSALLWTSFMHCFEGWWNLNPPMLLLVTWGTFFSVDKGEENAVKTVQFSYVILFMYYKNTTWLKSFDSNWFFCHRYLTDSSLHLYARNTGRASDATSSREISQRGSKEVPGDIDR